MVKKSRKITETQFKLGIAVAVVLFIGLFYYAITSDRLQVHESDFLLGEDTLTKQPLSYKTEFCANRLSNLAHEIHFFEGDIAKETEIIKKEGTILNKEETIIELEQVELSELKSQFEKYKKSCDEFDENPTTELCNKFLEEAKQNLDLSPKDRTVARIYRNLIKKCQGDEGALRIEEIHELYGGGEAIIDL